MKKLYLILVLMAAVATVQAQSQLKTVRGKTKDGKNVVVQYYQGSFEDRIESVKYQVVDELQSNVKTLQNNVRDLQNHLDAANKQIKQLNNDLRTSSKKNQNDQDLSQQIEIKEAEIALLTLQIDSLGILIEQVNMEKSIIQGKLDSITAIMQEKSIKQSTTESAPIIGIELGIGSTIINSGLNAPWVKNFTWNKQLAVYFGTARFTESLPLSIEAGIGINQLPISAYIYQYSTQINGWEDIDGDICSAHYNFDNLSERLTMTSIGIPVRLCIGQPIKETTTVYAKLGITPSLLLASTFSRKGRYSLKGEYPQWGVTLEDIQELGYHSNVEFDNKPSKVIATNMFNLWGNLAVGTYIPIGSTILVNMGLKLDYPILGSSTFTAADGNDLNIQGWDGLLNSPQKALIASFEIGIIYSLK